MKIKNTKTQENKNRINFVSLEGLEILDFQLENSVCDFCKNNVTRIIKIKNKNNEIFNVTIDCLRRMWRSNRQKKKLREATWPYFSMIEELQKEINFFYGLIAFSKKNSYYLTKDENYVYIYNKLYKRKTTPKYKIDIDYFKNKKLERFFCKEL